MDFTKVYNPALSQKIMSFGLGAFIVGFFVFFTKHAHNLWFYIVFLAPALFYMPMMLKKTQISHAPLFWLLIAYLVYMPATSLWDLPGQFDSDVYKPFIHSLYVFSFLMAIVYVYHSNPKSIDKIFSITLVAATIVATASIVWWTYKYHNFTVRMEGLGRLSHQIQGAAAYGVMFLLCIERLSFHPSQSLKQPINIGYLIAAAIFFCFILLGQSRGVLISLMAATAVLLFLKKETKILIYGIVVCVIVGLVAKYLAHSQEDLYTGLTRPMSYRPEIWSIVWEKALQHPWFGYGFAYPSEVTIASGEVFSHAHNIYLATFFHGGIIGLALYCALVLAMLYKTFVHRDTSIYRFAFALLIFSGIAMLSDVGSVIENPRECWLYFWLPIGLGMTTISIRKMLM